MWTRLMTATALMMSVGCGDADLDALQSLDGTYADRAPYGYGDAFGHRTFTFDDGRWTLDFTLWLDPDQQLPVFSFRTLGAFDVLGPSETVSDAYEAVFTEESKFLTSHLTDTKLIQAFGFADCGLTPDVEANISSSGCALWKSVDECGEDHDLLAWTADGGLRFGERPADNDMCTADKRPTSLTPPVYPQP